ncbi:DUF4129 domain-containing protein [Actinokineospora cianjurensis]|uniref:Uncharacterized protein DUF4129 n=1 Tax=Actinokineospora cianjurensis TaxID=585224 RepID=A0A421AXH1_9PSEU|nr:DUF4129 domain-containing protein [Actinokineospora cianjurensis]RLK54489.1 uncharacterized protein DUF4129 [Actinokineospora cianjurensis]
MSPRLAPPLVATALLLLAVAAARGSSAIPAGPGTAAPPDPDPAAAPAATAATDPNPVLDLISGISTALLLLAVATMLVVGLVGLAANLVGRRTRRALPELDWSLGRVDGEGVSAVPHLAAAARSARLDLTGPAAGDPTNAVIAAWLTLERGAARLGTPRAAHETPTEFAEHILAAHAVDPQALVALRRTYHRARFSPTAVITPRDVDAAADALARIERSLVDR